MRPKRLLFIFALISTFIFTSGCSPENTIDFPGSPTATLITSNLHKPTLIKVPPTETSIPKSPDGYQGPLQVHFVDVGQGDAELIITPHRNTILIDGGEKGSGVIPYLASVGVNKIDVMIATHPHSDHIGGLVEVLNTMPVSEVVTNGEISTTDLFSDFLTGIETANASYVEMSRGETFTVDGITFISLHPSKTFSSSDLNQSSLVLRMTYDNVSFLFTGDAGFDAEQDELASGFDLNSDILKVAHHGSSTSTSVEFLQQVAPKIAIYSAGVNNQFGHPSQDTVDRILSQGVELYGTDVNGTIIVTVNETGYEISLNHGSPLAPPVVIPNKTVAPVDTIAPTDTEVPTNTIEPTSTMTAVPPTATKAPLPTATKAVVPTAQPTKPPAPSLSISVVSLTSPINAGATATLVVKTSPGANCSITVYYKSGPSTAAGLGSKQADGNGTCSWSWKVGSRTASGQWSIAVSASANGKSTSIQIPFVVK